MTLNQDLPNVPSPKLTRSVMGYAKVKQKIINQQQNQALRNVPQPIITEVIEESEQVIDLPYPKPTLAAISEIGVETSSDAKTSGDRFLAESNHS